MTRYRQAVRRIMRCEDCGADEYEKWVMKRQIRQRGNEPHLCRECADIRRAISPQVKGSEPPPHPKRYGEETETEDSGN